jgi:rubredoxin
MTEQKRRDLKCAACLHEFTGYALVNPVDDVEESSAPTRWAFLRALSSCPNCGSTRVGEPGDPIFTNDVR